MSSDRKGSKNTWNNRKDLSAETEKRKRQTTDDSFDEADRILEQLDRMGLGDQEDASARTKKLIREDKEAIRRMKEEMDRLQEDDTDYLDDEKPDDYLPDVNVDPVRLVVRSTEDSKGSDKDETSNVSEKKHGKKSSMSRKSEKRKNNDRSKKEGRQEEEPAGEEADERKSEVEKAEPQNAEKQKTKEQETESKVKAGKGAGTKIEYEEKEAVKKNVAGEKNARDHREEKISVESNTEEEKADSDEETEEEVKLDFFKSLEREYPKQTTALRKKQPKKPEMVRNESLITRLYRESRRIFFVAVTVTVLLVVLFVALAIDASHKPTEEKQSEKAANAAFLSMDTKPMMQLMEDYYTALYKEDYDTVRLCLYGGKDIAEKDLKEQSKIIQRYREVVSDFSITRCYVQQGLHDNEYIVYMKFQLKIQSVETPAVGIYTTYLIEGEQKADSDATASSASYRLYMGLNDKDSDIYQYISKMKKDQAVVKLFADTDAELAEACRKDQNLQEIVEALGGSSS